MCFGQIRKGRQHCPNWRSKDDNVWSGPNRKISFGIFEICWGLAIDRETYASSSTGYFDRNTVQEFVDMERARMKVTRVCVYHVDHDSAGKSHGVTGEVFAHMLFECICHQVTIVGGDANRLCYQSQENSWTALTACRLANSGQKGWNRLWTDISRMSYRTTRTLMSVNSTPCPTLIWSICRILLVEDKTCNVMFVMKQIKLAIVVCWLSLNMVCQHLLRFFKMATTVMFWNTSILWMNFCFIWQMMFCVAWEGQGCTLPIIGHNWTFWYDEQGEENLQHCEQKKQRAANRKEIQKLNKAKGKARASQWGILFTRKDNF